MDASRLTYSMAEAGELPAIARLLGAHGLPTADITEHLEHFLVVKDRGEIIAVAGLEMHGPDALLRSVCVRESHRSAGLATQACEMLERYARNLGVARFYLLTNTAQDFFQRRGFEVCARDAAPARIRATAEFESLCPASAVCMTRALTGG